MGFFQRIFVKNWIFFDLFILGKIGQENMFNDILERKNAFLVYKNIKLKKWKKLRFFQQQKTWDFFKGVSQWFLSKKWQFSHLFILGKIGQEKVLNDILAKKTAFLDYKSIKFKKSNNWDFSKGVSPWFLSENWQIFNLFLFAAKKVSKMRFTTFLI